LKFGYLAFSDVGPASLSAGSTTPGILLATKARVADLAAAAKAECDVLIVSFHFGNEYQTAPTPRQKELARTAIDFGAKIVVGHHAHVVEPIEKYKDGLIMYSLGNFLFDQYFSTSTMRGAVVKIQLRGEVIENIEQLNSVIDNKYRVRVE
jgi:poly-gamma-glutamate synthesis protein (capsule biosynthesis protein)